MAEEEATLLAQYGQLNSRMQSYLTALNQILETRGTPTITWTVKMNHTRDLIESANEILRGVRYPPPAAVETVIATMYQHIEDLDIALLSVQNIINVSDAARAGDQIISELTQLESTIPDTESADQRGLFTAQKHDLYTEWSANKYIADSEKQAQVASAFRAVEAKIRLIKILEPSSSPAASEHNSSFQHDFEPTRRSSTSKIDWKLIPSWDGDSNTYQPWKHRITTILSQYDLNDEEKSNILSLDFVIKKKELIPMLQGLSFSEQFAMLDLKYTNTCRLFSHKLQLLDSRQMSAGIDDYTMMISVMQGIFRHINTIDDARNLLKYHLFMSKFLPKFPEITRREVTKRMNAIQEPEDMDKILLEFDQLKWLLVDNTKPAQPAASGTPKKPYNQQPRQDKKRAHAVNAAKKKCMVPTCSENHGLYRCELFKQMTGRDRHELVV
ncbi:MAG: hypothetical protein GY928_03350, partial [Colwellia sp.]|nr:hypothetical protein [Colwellia sp.]